MNKKEPEYIVIENSILIYEIESFDKDKNKASLILYKNLEDFRESNSLKRIDVSNWLD